MPGNGRSQRDIDRLIIGALDGQSVPACTAVAADKNAHTDVVAYLATLKKPKKKEGGGRGGQLPGCPPRSPAAYLGAGTAASNWS
jgi:hypothetical protein